MGYISLLKRIKISRIAWPTLPASSSSTTQKSLPKIKTLKQKCPDTIHYNKEVIRSIISHFDLPIANKSKITAIDTAMNTTTIKPDLSNNESPAALYILVRFAWLEPCRSHFTPSFRVDTFEPMYSD